jgi:galactokinase
MDQFAVAMGKKDNAILLDCDDLSFKYMPAKLGSFRLVIMDTGKRLRLEDSKYSRRRAECDAALAMIRRHKDVRNLCAATPEDVESYVTDETLQKRARHVVSEDRRTIRAADFLAQGDLGGFGRLLTESHNSLRRDYEVTGPELDAIVEVALSVGGCLGARMTGAGFGGCAIALVRAWEVLEFVDRVKSGYRKKTRLEASIYDCAIGDGVRAGIPELPVPR